jgi:hypothetical protein
LSAGKLEPQLAQEIAQNSQKTIRENQDATQKSINAITRLLKQKNNNSWLFHKLCLFHLISQWLLCYTFGGGCEDVSE